MKILKKALLVCTISLAMGALGTSFSYASETVETVDDNQQDNIVDLMDSVVYLIDENGNVMPVPYSEVTMGGITIANGVTAVWFNDDGLWADANTRFTWTIYTDAPATYSTWVESIDGSHTYDFGNSNVLHGETFRLWATIKAAGSYKYCITNYSATDLTIKKCTLEY